MHGLHEQLQSRLQGRVCVVGVGNVDAGDDAFGVRLAEELEKKSRAQRAKCEPPQDCEAGDHGEPALRTASHEPGRVDLRSAWTRGSASLLGAMAVEQVRKDQGPLHPAHHMVLLAGMAPERFVGRLIDAGFDHVIFLDAVDCGSAPGAVVFLDSRQMAARFPQVSTHKISLGLLARCLEANGTTRACLLGVQPQSLKPGADLTPAIQTTLHLLAGVLGETLLCAARPPALPGPQPAIP